MEAKEATSLDNMLIKRIPHSDMKRPIRSYILGKWQERWSSQLLVNNKKYKKIREFVSPWLSSFNGNRKVEVILTRLRIGHTHLTHKYILEGNSAPVCVHCDGLLSVEHILVHCPKFTSERRKYCLSGKSISDILGDEIDIENLIKFLQKIGIFNLI